MLQTNQFVLTQGVQSLNLDEWLLSALFVNALTLYNESIENYMVVAKEQNGSTILQDGNYNQLGGVPLPVPETIWFITDDHGEGKLITTALLPEEY